MRQARAETPAQTGQGRQLRCATAANDTDQRIRAQHHEPRMHDLATPQGRIAWVRERILRMEADELVEEFARLPDPWRYATNKGNISRYERGRRTVQLDYYRALSHLSGFSLDWLIEGRTPRGSAIDAIRRVRYALDQIEETYRTDPLDVPPDAYERLDTDDHSTGST